MGYLLGCADRVSDDLTRVYVMPATQRECLAHLDSARLQWRYAWIVRAEDLPMSARTARRRAQGGDVAERDLMTARLPAVRMHAAEVERIIHAAAKAGESVSSWIRRTLDEAA